MGNDQFNLKDNIFYLDVIPNISLEYFINHLFKYTNMSISSLILAIIYIDQFCEKFKYALSMHNIFRILLIFVYISIKLNEDINKCVSRWISNFLLKVIITNNTSHIFAKTEIKKLKEY